MSEEATLFLLKDKLERVRKTRRNNNITVFVTVIVLGLLWNVYYKFDSMTGFLIVVGLPTFVTWLINGYYDKQEIAVLRQIENLAGDSGY